MRKFQKIKTQYYTAEGYTLVEVCIAMVIICILASMAAPIYTKAVEQARLDSAAGNLKTIWSAQRAYWLKYHTFAADLTTLENEDLVSSALAATEGQSNAVYVYGIESASASAFAASATRNGSSTWGGEIQIDESGAVSGEINGSDSTVLSPLTME